MDTEPKGKPDVAGSLWRAPDMQAEEIAELRAMTLEERGHQLAMACRAAARIERSRRQMGLAPSESVPWPASTWEFLKRTAGHGTH